jgi:diguanylate cyclase (GGDEF)-like protein/PAS domain S-box-containing protein
LRRTLGGSTDEIHAQITRIGLGHVEEPIEVPTDLSASVLGGLARTQRNLNAMREAQRLADANLQRLTRLYAALSQSRQSILHCMDQRTLFEQVCQIAVESGGMRLAWVGVPDPQTHRVMPVARFGVGAEFIDGMVISVDPAQTGGQGPSALVVGRDQAFWCQDLQADPFMARWHEVGRLGGWASMAALPVHRDGGIMAIFYIYAGDLHAFDAETQRMLLEMGADFDAALRSLDRDAAQRESQQKDALGRFMLERLVSDSSLAEILNDFVLELERLMPGAICSILRLDEERQVLNMGAAPNLPDFYNTAIDGVSIGVGVGSCGTAAAIGQRVIVGDIANHPYWVIFKDLAQQAGLASCWSEPIMSGAKTVLGSFAVYHSSPVMPESFELGLIELAANLAAIAIERKDAEVQLQLKARVFEQGNEAIVITDRQRQIVRVNHAFTRMTGYSEAEAMGQNPSLLSSGRHDVDFYREMWASLDADDHWQGEVWNRRKDGTDYPEWLSITVLRDRLGVVMNYVGIATDITQRKEDEAQIRQLVNYDPLTGLPNRRLLQDRVKTALSHAQRAHQPLALMFVDLDRFKNVNDSLGHHVGDELLIQVARRLVDVLRDQDTVCRLGGDEFVLLCPHTDAAGAARLAEKLLESVARRFSLTQQELAVTFSIGVAMYPSDGDSFEALSMRADAAMYRAKHAGRNAYRFFTAEMQTESSRTLQLENGLSRALELNQFHLVYQPQMSLDSGQIVGVEALLRWQHPTLGQVSPAEFIPVAEDSGLILPIGEWVLRTAVAQLRCWQDMGLGVPLMAVNLSAVQFRHANLPDLVTRVLEDAGLAPECLELELTEGVTMDDPAGAMAVMKRLNQRGVRMAIDDFGTGYSSLSYLKRFPADRLKIDQSFVRDIAVDPDDKAIVVAIIALARSLGFLSMAEGVETPGQLAFLREQGCDEVQGYLFCRPLTPAQFEVFFLSHQPAETLDT